MIKPEPLSLGHARPSYTTPGDTIVGGNVLNLTLKRDFAVGEDPGGVEATKRPWADLIGICNLAAPMSAVL